MGSSSTAGRLFAVVKKLGLVIPLDLNHQKEQMPGRPLSFPQWTFVYSSCPESVSGIDINLGDNLVPTKVGSIIPTKGSDGH